MVIITASWNTNLVKKEDEPKQFDDFADPKWKGKLIAEGRDVELLIGLARHKFKNDEKAIDFLRKLAANNIEFHKGHSELAEFLVAGQAAVCVTCYAHHYPPRIKKGAPLGYMLTRRNRHYHRQLPWQRTPHIPTRRGCFTAGPRAKKGRRPMRREAACRRIRKWNPWKKFARRRSIRSAQMKLRTGTGTKRSGRRSSNSVSSRPSILTCRCIDITVSHRCQSYHSLEEIFSMLVFSLRFRLIALVTILLAAGVSQVLRAQTLDELHKLALKEGGTLNFYGTSGADQRGENPAGFRETISRHQDQPRRCHLR